LPARRRSGAGLLLAEWVCDNATPLFSFVMALQLVLHSL
jgi:hypothetical protein